MLAFVLAIGMSFAFTDAEVDEELYAAKHILTSQGWVEITVQCPQLGDDCVVKFDDDPFQTEYRVYNSEDLEDPAEGAGNVIKLPGDVPDPEL